MKRFLKLFSVLLVVVMMTGCVKYNMNMKITNDKKMTIEIITAASKSLMEGAESSDDTESIEELKKKGFKVEDYKDDSWQGYKLTKTYDNIDKLSTKEEVKVDLNKLLNGEEPEYFFQKDGDKYKAVFSFSLSSTDGNTADPNADPTEEPSLTTGSDDTTLTVDDDDNDYFDSNDNEIDYSGLYSTMDIKYTVEVPKAGKNNATSTDGNKLTWDLTKLNNEDITFEFEVNGNSNLVMYAAIAAAVVGVIIVVGLLASKKGKKTPEAPVVTPTTE